MKPSITPGPTAPRRLVLVLSRAGLGTGSPAPLGPIPSATAIFGPSCIVGACGGPPRAPGRWSKADDLPPGTVRHGRAGRLRLHRAAPEGLPRALEPVRRHRRRDAAGQHLVRLAGPLAGDKRRDPAVVVVDDAGRFAVSVLGGQGARADDLAHQVAAILGAAAGRYHSRSPISTP